MNASTVPATAANRPKPDPTGPALRRLRIRVIHNVLRSVLSGARLRTSMILGCSVVFWTGLYVLFAEAFRFLATILPLSNEVVEYIFSMFFLSLLIMLIFSTGIILYSSLFQSKEAAFLLTTPAPADRVFAHKFAEAIAFSSWGFFLLGSPILIAYGVTARVPWPFYAFFLPYLAAFALIPGSCGAIGAILVANLIPRRRKTALAVLIGLVGLAVAVVGYRLWWTPGETMSREWLDAMLGRLEFSQNMLLPSRWLSKGLLESARGQAGSGGFYLFVTVAHAGIAYLIAAAVARDLYRRGYSRVQGGRGSRRAIGWYGLDALFHRLFGPLISRPVRLLILKDLRTFRRDPVQWSQFFIFFGLLAFYFGNIPRLGYHVENAVFKNLLSFLNLGVTALILSTFTGRFIFPMMSLEGRNFWVLGLLPLDRAAILWGKFAFASGIALASTELLVVLSDVMLRITPMMTALHMLIVAILCLGLSGISVGLGARLPNLREEDPSKIAAGFGGTLNLLVSLVFIVLVVGSLAVPCHFYFSSRKVEELGASVFADPAFRLRIGLGLAACLTIGAAAIVLPLRIGIRAFREMEF